MIENLGIQDKKVTAMANSQPKQVFRLAEVPLILFDEVSAQLGIGEEFLFDGFRCRILDPNSKHTGFEGTIGLRTFDEFNRAFVIWGRVPSPEQKDTVAEPVHLLNIHAWPEWVNRDSTLTSDVIRADLQRSGYSLEGSAATLIALCFLRASQLARDPACRKRRFWEKSEVFTDD